MKINNLSDSEKERIVMAVINSNEAQEVIHQLAIAIAPAMKIIMSCIGQAIEEELSKAAEIDESEIALQIESEVN